MMPIWLALFRLGAGQNGRLAGSLLLLLPAVLCFALFLAAWPGMMPTVPDSAEVHGGMVLGVVVSAGISSLMALLGFGVGFCLESRYGHRRP